MANLQTVCYLWQLYDLFWDTNVISVKDAIEIVHQRSSVNKGSAFDY